ncbi:unnamed protein product [Tilletia laevis]|uniref:U1-type domain-containing protein n=2 Tax=Tilletia TaxID=13289 RepID=A0A9N8LNN7_9BASI|nr:unnamed protein product [Tilletia caries]CAD6914099.1 unnamed protein product [Tilletia laevis]CAD6922528.1 unnamed protein product [Tilletia caries]CAD6942905.1 unnamed protein product [Tilletia laevis]CAD6959526.1 unnamed protein product [Tilletia caries]
MVNRWTCKYCDLTINDDVPSRAAHEGGFRHKAAVERALRQTYKKAERGRRDAAIQAKEIAKLDKGDDEGEALLAGSKRKRNNGKDKEDENAGGSGQRGEWKPKDKFTAYTTAANLGLGEDPEDVRAREEKELRQKEGFASQWSVVDDPTPPSVPNTVSASSSMRGMPQATAPKAASTTTSTDDPDDLRSFKTQEKKAPQLHDDDDDAPAGELVFKKRTKKRRA